MKFGDEPFAGLFLQDLGLDSFLRHGDAFGFGFADIGDGALRIGWIEENGLVAAGDDCGLGVAAVSDGRTILPMLRERSYMFFEPAIETFIRVMRQ